MNALCREAIKYRIRCLAEGKHVPPPEVFAARLVGYLWMVTE